MDFYSGENVMSLFKVKQSWLYTTAKRNRIPICRIAGKNYYSKKHVDEFFGVAVDTSNITDWLLIEEAEELFGNIIRRKLKSTAKICMSIIGSSSKNTQMFLKLKRSVRSRDMLFR